MYPIIGGPSKIPKKLTLETAVSASPGMVGCLPARLIRVPIVDT
jgi:hypothetical protein